MGFLLPAGLLALFALLLPLLLHLARRQSLRPTPFAALRWLHAKAKPRRRIRFDERLLLVLRLLLLVLFALWLAHPAAPRDGEGGRWSLLVPGVDPATLPPPRQGEVRRWLLPGWPALDDGVQAHASVPVGALLRQIDSELPSGVTVQVFVPDTIDGADAQRPRLSRAVDWQVMPASPTAIGADDGSGPPRLSILHDGERADALRHLRAAVLAWHGEDVEDAIDIAGAAAPLPSTSRTLAWLVAGDVPDAVRAFAGEGGTVLLADDVAWPATSAPVPVWKDGDGRTLASAMRHGSGRIVQLARPLRPVDWPGLLDPGFAVELRGHLSPPSPAPMRAVAADYQPEHDGDLRWPAAMRDLRGPLLWAILLLLLAERWLATTRRREQGP